MNDIQQWFPYHDLFARLNDLVAALATMPMIAAVMRIGDLVEVRALHEQSP